MHPRSTLIQPTETAVRTLMTSEVLAVHPEDPLHKAVRIMRLRDCGSVPVTDRDGRVVGMVTDRDVALAADEYGTTTRSMRVSSAMTREPVTVELEDTLSEALEVMRMRQVRRVPVVDANHRLAGVVTIGDVVGYVATMRRRGADSTISDALVETLAAIGEPRPSSVALLVCST